MPCWPSAPFWPLVCKTDGQLASFVIMTKELPLTKELFLPGLSGNVIFNGDIPSTKVWALKCNSEEEFQDQTYLF